MYDFFQQFIELVKHYFNESIILLSIIFSCFLNLIGYPKEIIIVIVVLCIVDVLSKWYSVTVINKGSFTFYNLLTSWFVDRKLTSEKFRIGLCAKILFYGLLLYIAHQLTLCKEVIAGNFISDVIYSSMFFTEIISIGENISNTGNNKLKPFIDFFRKKQDKILDIDNK